MYKVFSCIFALLATLSAHANDPPFDAEALDFFESRIRPVLVENCFKCHGPDQQKAGLRLDSRAAFLRGSDTGPVVVPGNADASRLAQVIRYDGPVAMPPDGKLPDETVEALNHWIALGAPWPEEIPATDSSDTPSLEDKVVAARATHWAFQPVSSPTPPQIENTGWVRENLDRFVVAQLEARQLAPSPKADRRTLIRRLYFDLIGLPPSMDDVRAFEADTAPGAYERQVDALLASSHFGERWARYWLDVARYADTRGYVFQQERDFAFSHTYRDYVINAFNADLPYDAFIRQQLAADKLAPDDTKAQAAMGFLTLGRNFVGNLDDQTDDRIDVVTRGMLGLTVSCARCHDHKFDPVSAADYYALYGIFRSSVEPRELPLLEEPDPEDPAYMAFQQEVGEKEATLQAYIADRHVDMLTQTRERAADYILAASQLPADANTEAVRTLAKERDLLWQILETWFANLKTRAAAESRDPIFTPWFSLAAIPAENYAEAAKAFFEGEFIAEAYRGGLNPEVLAALGTEPPESLEAVAARYGALFEKADKAWTRLLAAATQTAAQTGQPVVLPETLSDPNLEAVRLVLYAADSPDNVPRGQVENYSTVPVQGEIRNRRNARVRVENTHPGRPDRAMAVTDAAQLLDPYVFLRGKSDRRGEDVPRRLPLLLASEPAIEFPESSGRAGLAEAIAWEDNPLTARVYVNRVWEKLFGSFLVGTPSDFGLRADPPTNPELLDHLARTFMDDGWSVKRLIRRIVLSATYRQSSADRPEARAVDEANVYYWRQNRRRLDFEAMRDSLLATAGDLDATMGGPAVEIAAVPYANRRTIYGQIERQNLPGLFRTFDFASPDTHSPQRFTTTVPQQALYLMNSPFAIEQARDLAALPVIADTETPQAMADALFRRALQRDPKPEEQMQSVQLLATAKQAGPPQPRWEYGYGRVDADLQETTFTPFPNYRNNQYQGAGGEFPAPELGWCSISQKGGHPGDPAHSVILRWNAPGAGTVRVRGRLDHASDQGDGVTGTVVHSESGIVWEGTAFHEETTILVKTVHIDDGDMLDLVVGSGETTSFDSFGYLYELVWTPQDTPNGEPTDFKASMAFAPPPPPPLAPAEQLAQVLLMTNEFIFID